MEPIKRPTRATRARGLPTMGTRNPEEELLKLLQEQLGQKAEPRARPLERIFAPFRALGSVPDAAYRARYEGANPFLEYLSNLAGGVGTAVLGRPEKDYKEASDILMKEGRLLGQDPGTKFARSALDIGASIATNPLTFTSFGPATVASKLAKPSARAALVAAGKSTKAANVNKLAKLAEGKSMNEGIKAISNNKSYGEGVASAFHDTAKALSGTMTEAGARLPSLKAPGSVKLMGQQVTDVPWAGEAVKSAINPFYAIGKGTGALGQKFAPSFTRNLQARFYDTFAPQKAAAMAGRSALGRESLKKLGKQSRVEGRAQEVIAERLRLEEKVPSIERGQLAKWIDESHLDPRTGKVIFQGDDLAKASMSKQAKDFLKLHAEQENMMTGRLKERLMKDPKVVEKLGAGGPKMDEKGRLIFPEKKAEEITKTQFDSLRDLTLGKKKPRPTRPTILGDTGDPLLHGSERAGKFLDKTGKIIDPHKQTYLMHKHSRVPENAIRTIYGKDATRILENPKVAAQLAKGDKKAKFEDVRKAVEDLGIFKPKGTKPGIRQSDLIQRKYPTIREGEKAGIEYVEDMPTLLKEQAERQLGRLDDYDFGQTISRMSTDKGVPLFSKTAGAQATESMKLPGVGTRYTDPKTKRVLENYFDTFGGDTGLDETLKGLDKLMYEWKGYVTGKGPGFIQYHIRNYLDDNIRMVLGGAKVQTLPTDYHIARDAIGLDRLIKQKGEKAAMKAYAPKHADDVVKYLKQIGKKPGENANQNLKMLLDEFKEQGVYSDVAKATSEAFGAGWDNMQPRQTIEDFFTFKGKLTDEEQARRIAMYTNVFRQKGNAPEAQQAVRDVLFNYLELSKAERTTGRRLIPFYSFVKNNLKFQFEAMFNDPQAYSKFVHVMDGLQSGFTGPDGDKVEAMPEWMRRRYSIPIGEREGELHMLTNLGLSFDDLEELDAEGLFGKLSPAIKMPIEMTTGHSMFHRAPIDEVMRSGKLYEQHPLRGLMGYKEEEREGWTQQTVDPRARYMAENVPFVSSANLALRNIGRTTRPFGPADAKESGKALFDWKIPGKIHERNIESGAKRREIDDLEALYELLYRRGEADRFSRYYIPADIRDKLLKEMRR